MKLILFISAKNFSDFIERFFLNAITPIILILLVIYLVKFKQQKCYNSKPFCYFIIFYIAIDLFLRLYYTFVLNMENQTRYFLMQVIFYLIPAAAAWEYIGARQKLHLRHYTLVSYIVIFLFGAIVSLRPKWDKPEYEVFTELISKDPVKTKFIAKMKKKEDGSYGLKHYLQLYYYSGNYVNMNTTLAYAVAEGSCYLVSKEKLTEYKNYKLNQLAVVEDGKEKAVYLYKVTLAT